MLLGKYINKYYLKYIIYLIIGVLSLIIVDYWGLLIPEYLGEIIDLFNEETALKVKDAGASMVVSATYLHNGIMQERIDSLR